MPKYAPHGDDYFIVEKKLRGWAIFLIALLGALSTVSLFAFKTNAVADVEHAKLHGDLGLAKHKISTQADDLKAIIRKLDMLQGNQILIGERLRVRGLARGDE